MRLSKEDLASPPTKHQFLKAMLLAIVSWVAFLPVHANADGSITDGAITLDYLTGRSLTGGNATVSGIDGSDHLYGIHFLYRIEGDVGETLLQSPTLEDYSDNVATLVWTDVDSRGLLDIEVRMTLRESATNAADFLIDVVLTNVDVSPVNMDLFLYLDPDMNGTFGGDSAELITSPGHIRVFETTQFDFVAVNNDAYQVAAFPGLATTLEDSAVTDLDNTGLPFGPADATLAFQWADRTINPGSELAILLATGANQVPSLPQLPPTPVPAVPLSGLLLASLGLFLLACRRLKRLPGTVMKRARD